MRALTFTTGLALLLVVSLAAADARAEEISVEAQRREGALEVLCRALVEAPVELIWQTLTDYNRLAEFIPGMTSSRVLSRSGAVAVVEQLGAARFLFVSIPIEVTVASTERPPHAIEAKMLKGNLKRLEGAYRIEPLADGRVRLSWRGIIEAEAAPPLIGDLLMRSTIEDQFRGMVQEIERREELRRVRAREAQK